VLWGQRLLLELLLLCRRLAIPLLNLLLRLGLLAVHLLLHLSRHIARQWPRRVLLHGLSQRCGHLRRGVAHVPRLVGHYTLQLLRRQRHGAAHLTKRVTRTRHSTRPYMGPGKAERGVIVRKYGVVGILRPPLVQAGVAGVEAPAPDGLEVPPGVLGVRLLFLLLVQEVE
jgi:hypothetical protein